MEIYARCQIFVIAALKAINSRPSYFITIKFFVMEKEEVYSKKPIDSAEAKKMIEHQFKSPHVLKPKCACWTEFNVDELREILDQKDIISVKFFLAAFPDDDAHGNKKNQTCILLQLKMETPSPDQGAAPVVSYSYYSGTGKICPPPTVPPCTIEA
jgi:hypothetical protein